MLVVLRYRPVVVALTLTGRAVVVLTNLAVVVLAGRKALVVLTNRAVVLAFSMVLGPVRLTKWELSDVALGK